MRQRVWNRRVTLLKFKTFGARRNIHLIGSRLFNGNGHGKGSVVPLHLLEECAIRHALKVTDRNITRAASLLRIGRATLYRRVKQYGISL